MDQVDDMDDMDKVDGVDAAKTPTPPAQGGMRNPDGSFRHPRRTNWRGSFRTGTRSFRPRRRYLKLQTHAP